MKERSWWLVFPAAAVLLLLASCGLAAFALGRMASPDESFVQVIPEQKQGRLTPGEIQEERICAFAPGLTAEGEVVPAGTIVEGPAFAKPDRDLDWGHPIYVGEKYTTTASDEVVWLLIGDNACVDAQSLFFTYWSQNSPTN